MGEKLTRAQRSMLSGPFYIDGWHNRDFLPVAEQLVTLGWLSRRTGGGDQYTVLNYEPTDAGRQALESSDG